MSQTQHHQSSVVATEIPITTQMLWDYLDEQLPENEMIAVEKALRDSQQFQQRLIHIRELRDSGEHTLGAIWRRYRVSCPTREVLAIYLRNAGDPRQMEYVHFHLNVVGCRYCQANVTDLSRNG
ncbi:MAG: hypothetical protein NZ703_00700 [Gemmataceae bacterium]|nr:hypothetical protein [Gemmataceae bacterium]MCS7269577.1 hypothetical protein [Gemmataceae bacterium]MDW8243896.1 hypothetical protein [Thermogemmata sp.]